MAERRMLTKKVTDDDNFVALSSSAQALYLHLSMSADDDGFCNQVSISMFRAHASVQDLQSLLEKRYIYQFENGVIVIKHWRMANALRKDRYTPTAFQEEMSRLGLKDNGAYTWLPDGCQLVADCLPQDSIGKVSIGKESIKESMEQPAAAPAPAPKPKTTREAKHKHGEYGWVRLTEKQYQKLITDLGPEELIRCITYLDESAQSTGNKNEWKDWNLVIRRCAREGWGRTKQQTARRNSDFDSGNPFLEMLAERQGSK